MRLEMLSSPGSVVGVAGAEVTLLGRGGASGGTSRGAGGRGWGKKGGGERLAVGMELLNDCDSFTKNSRPGDGEVRQRQEDAVGNWTETRGRLVSFTNPL